MTRRPVKLAVAMLALMLASLLGVAQPAQTAEPAPRYFLNSGERQYLKLSTNRVAVKFASSLSKAEIDSIIRQEPRLSSVWSEASLPGTDIILCELIPDLSDEQVSELLASLNEQPSILKATPSYSVGDNALIPNDRLIIKFKSAISPEAQTEFTNRYDVSIYKRLTWLDHAMVLSLDSYDSDPLDLALQLGAEPNVVFCHPDFIRLVKQLSSTPNDSLFGLQWNMNNDGSLVGRADADIDLIEAWDHARGRASVSIAVIDEGVDTTHEDLAGKIVNQYDATDQDDIQQPNSWDGHGTAIAGVAAAIPNNSVGLAGVAWNCSIMPVRMAYKVSPLPVIWVTSDEVVADAIATAVIRGADVLSLSWGLTYSSEIIYAAILFAKTDGRNGKGCVIVGSAGNSDGNAILYPGAYNEAIAVGATNEWDERKSKISQDGETTWGSNYGPELDVVAPGVHIWTTDIMGTGGFNTANPLYGDSVGNYWNRFNGTSAAVPHVAGLAALIISIKPELTSDSVQVIIENSADDLVGLPGEDIPGWDQYMGHGRINVHAAVKDLSDILYVEGTISENRTWDTSLVYVVTGELTIPTGVTLTIEAGTIVKFDYLPITVGTHQRPKLIVDGTLNLLGTEFEPVIFTSIRDDQFGGDTNFDSTATSPVAGDWGYLKLSGSNPSLTNCIIRYAGVGWFEQSEVDPFPVTYHDKYSLWLDRLSVDFTLSDCTIEQTNITTGEETVNSVAVLWDASSSVSTKVTMFNNVITGGQDGLRLVGQPVGSSAKLDSNYFSNLSGLGIYAANLADSVTIATNKISGGSSGIFCSDCQPNLLIDSNLVFDQLLVGIELEACEGSVTNNSIEQSGAFVGQASGMIVSNGSILSIERNSISRFDIGLDCVSSLFGSPPDLTISLNSIYDNQTYGIRLASTDTVIVDGPRAVIINNDLTGNSVYNLFLGAYQDPTQVLVDATYNWWGTGNSTEVTASIYDQADDIGSPVANYHPFRTNSVFLPDPVMEVDQTEFDVDLFPDSVATRTLTIYNFALWGDLIFSISEGIGEASVISISSVAGFGQADEFEAELEWLELDPAAGLVPPGDSLKIEISFDAASLPDSIYNGSIVIASNDSASNPLVLPVTLEVSEIFILSPNGGEQFGSGEDRPLIWHLVEFPPVDSINLWLSTDGGLSYPNLISSGEVETTPLDWRVPALATDSAKVLVEVFRGGLLAARDESDDLFSITISPYLCGQYNDGFTGNTNCDVEGKRNLADITRLIDRVYISKAELCDEAEGNVNGDLEAKLNLADITRLIDHIFGTKIETAPCQ